MDLAIRAPERVARAVQPSSAIVLACLSQRYFTAPIRSWISGESPNNMQIAAGKAYAQHQKISEGSGIGLFATGYAK